MTLDQLPDETLCTILEDVAPHDILASVSLVNRHLRQVSQEPLVWQRHCQTQFKYWADSNLAKDYLFKSGTGIQWKTVFEDRLRKRTNASGIFNSIVQGSTGRLDNYEAISRLDLDIKDYLLEELDCDEALPDYLARKYHARSLLDLIYRHKAIKEWHCAWLRRKYPARYAAEYPARPQTSRRVVERVLAAFDLFIGGEQNSDVDSTLAIFDRLAHEFKSAYPSLHENTIRQQARLLSAWVREQNLVGINNVNPFRNLRNCFIGQALRREDHGSLPIISVAIFCSLADRIGLHADLVNFPNQVLAVVQPQDKTLDGIPMSELSAQDREKHQSIAGNLYLPLWGAEDEMPFEILANFLRGAGLANAIPAYLGPADPLDILERMSHNLRAAISDLPRHDLMGQHVTTDIMAAECAAQWAQFFTAMSNLEGWNIVTMSRLSRVFNSAHPEDIWMLKDYVWDQFDFDNEPDTLERKQHYDSFRSFCTAAIARSNAGPQQIRRPSPDQDPVEHKIGQVFHHTRYGPQMVVTGWTQQGLDLEAAMAVASGRGRDDNASKTVFYSCISSADWEVHTIGPGSMKLITDLDEVRLADFPRAGKFFKRFDRETCAFVSNIRDEFPDD